MEGIQSISFSIKPKGGARELIFSSGQTTMSIFPKHCRVVRGKVLSPDNEGKPYGPQDGATASQNTKKKLKC